jgi:hypothetical protein
MEPNDDKPYLPNRIYEGLRWFVQIVLPAFSALYLGLSDLWDLPKPVAVGATAGLVGTFLGTIMRFSKHNYDNSDRRFVGETFLAPTDEGWKRIFNVTADEIDPNKKELAFKAVDSQVA